MSRRWKICSRGAIRICRRLSSGRCCLPESGPETAGRDWYISWRWKRPGEGWLRSILSWLARLRLLPEVSPAACASDRSARFAGNFDFAQLRAAGAQFLARLGGVVALGGVGAALELAGFALQRLQPLDGAVDLFDQALFLERGETRCERASCDISMRSAGHVILQVHVRVASSISACARAWPLRLQASCKAWRSCR